MIVAVVGFVSAFLLSVAATLGVRAMALRLGVVDRPDNFRKIHQREVPRLGGVAIYVAFTFSVLTLYLFGNTVYPLVKNGVQELIILLVSAAVVMGVGAVDDIRGLRARWKLLFQAIPATLAFLGGFAIKIVSNPFGAPIDLGIFSYPVTLFWFLGCMNAINLMDGLDGLAAGVSLFVALTLFLVSLLVGNVHYVLLACLCGAILGFLIFNFHPAKIFLGDAGSLLLGFLVGALAIMASRKAEATVALLIPIIALGIPILDTSLAILRRWSRNLPISAPDREHIHHILLSLGLSHRRVVLIIYGVCVLLGCAAVAINMGRNQITIVVLASLSLIAFICIRVFGGLRLTDIWAKIKTDMERRQRSADAKIMVEKAVIWMQSAQNPSELWSAAQTAFEGLGLDRVELRLFGPNGDHPLIHTFERPNSPHLAHSNGDVWSARLAVQNNGRVFGELAVHKSVAESPLLPDTPELLARLRSAMATQLERLHVV